MNWNKWEDPTPCHACHFGGKGGGGAASQAAQTSANTQADALKQIEQLIGQFGAGGGPLFSTIMPLLSGGGALNQGAPALAGFFSNMMNNGLDPRVAGNAQDLL